ncbi:hypothetical protein CFI00_16295 [Nocardioides sp. S5]|uniref:hypothetical protein n=1 Tax=Nocardioides sp. S5 TaxID=2017486 RepID=UPI001A8F566D|nr:hypothetical protein [Nocardioides sp. S5]QSR32040.1 hypothetical protein CFI00_16295 [Nocardioides sp. S5]
MLATLLVAVAMATCLGVAALARGSAPTRARVLGTTMVGIAAAVLAWILVGTVATVPESGVVGLSLFLTCLSVGLVRSGLRPPTPGRA